jgi:membrane protein YdbS with pleckstrin-like domain
MLDWPHEQDYASLMNLLPINDGSTYIDLSTADCFNVHGVTYCRSQYGVWARSEKEGSPGQIITERTAFKAFINANMPTEAKRFFPKLFEEGVKVEAVIEPDPKPDDATSTHLWRFVVAGLVVLLVAAYVAATIMGKIPTNRQIGLGALAVIVIGAVLILALFQPRWMHDVQRFQFGSFRLDMQQRLQEIQSTQKDQGKNLDEIHFILVSLVTSSEMNHLKDLARGSTANYKRAPTLLAELRRLRDVGLIEPIRKNYKFARLPANFDLADYVRLTKRGNEYLGRVGTTVIPPSTTAR